jgi:glycerol-3-phosphate dehydrogenase subunit B
MPISSDVVVVGGGLAGKTAALSAAKTGASVHLVTHKKSTLRNASGLVDVLGYVPDGEGPLPDPYAAMDELPEEHPYRIVGEDAVREGLELFDEAVGDSYLGGHTDTNALVPTHGGTVKPTARYPASSAAGLASDDRDMLLVGFEMLTDFDAGVAADHLEAAGVPFEVRGVTVPFPKRFRTDSQVTRFAQALDENEDANGRGTRSALAATVAAELEDEERVGFPALLGEDHPDEIRADLEAELGVDVFEVPMGPPSLPGKRLEYTLNDALDEAGVNISYGNPVVDYEADGDRIESVVVDRKGAKVPYAADQYVLATGGTISKGIWSDREGVRERVFGCHVPHPDDRYDWFVDGVFDDQPFSRFGVVPGDDLQPLDADGAPEFENLRAAGSVLGGANIAREKSGSGVSLATGLAAGRSAGELA